MTHQDKVWLVRELVPILGSVVILLLEIPGNFGVGASCYLGQTVPWGPFHVVIITYACMVLGNTRMWLSNVEWGEGAHVRRPGAGLVRCYLPCWRIPDALSFHHHDPEDFWFYFIFYFIF